MGGMGLLWVLVLSLAFTGTFGAIQGGNLCGAGYYSASGRLWNLAALQPAASNGYAVNLCGATNTTGSCSSDALLCSGSTILGRREAAVVDLDNGTSLVVNYGLGDLCGSTQYSVTITYHCQDASAGTFTVRTTSNSCQYAADLYVPTAMCATSPNSPAPYCQPGGYTDPYTGATWQFSTLSPDWNNSGYTYKLDVCGQRTDLTCNANSVLCQAGYSLGQRVYWDIEDYANNGSTLVVTYAFGDDCGYGIGYRRAYVFFHCVPSATTASFTVSEESNIGLSCNYNVNVIVPGTMCTVANMTGAPPFRPPPFCEPSGYTTPNQELYTLYNADFGSVSIGSFDYVLNPCGTQTTLCGSYSALCQEQSNAPSFSLGEWTSWSWRNPTESTGMSVQYTLGDGGRQSIVNFHCNGTGGQITFNLVESPPGVYNADVFVPPSYCGFASSTTPVVPDAPFCTGNGYYSNGRNWVLTDYNPSAVIWDPHDGNEYNYEFNLCGSIGTTCNPNSVLCQEPEGSPTVYQYSLGNREAYDIRTDLSNSSFLVVDYGLGDYCGAATAYRRITVFFQCTNIPAGTLPTWTVTQPSTCVYQVVVPVPVSFCQAVEPPVTPPFCDPNYGYFSPTLRLWNFNGLVASGSGDGYPDLVLDVCGAEQNPCRENSVFCQVDSPTHGYSVGDRNHYDIDTLASTDTTLVVNFALGDNCGQVGDRSAKMIFHCQTSQSIYTWPTNFTISEHPTCTYTIDVYIAGSYCQNAYPTQAPVTLPICNENGYISPAGTVWKIADFDPDAVQTGGYDVNLNLCGKTPTLCGSASAVCQESGSMYSMGSRSAGVIDLSLTTPTTLAIYYGSGDGSYCPINRNVLVLFQCQETSTYTPSVTVVELAECSYVVSISTPSTFCYTYQATSAPVAQPPFCNGAGYKSETNRLWTLEFFNIEATHGVYDYVLDICGHGTVTPWCNSGSALCQESDIDNNYGQGYSLGAWWAYEIVPQSNPANSDLVLTVKYGFGDNCGANGNREVTINFYCVLGTYVESFNISETSPGACRYVANIAVPSAYCQEATNVPTAPWCTPQGYYSPTQRLWTLNSFVPPPIINGGVTYALDLCGNEQTMCTYQSVTCQEYFGNEYSFALRATYEVNQTTSCDDTLVIEYGLGDYCGATGRDRTAEIRVHCNSGASDVVQWTVSEPNTCHYVVEAWVPPSMCQLIGPTQAPPALPAYCQGQGYVSSTNRAWNFADFAPNEYTDTAGSTYDLQLNPCGAVVTTCDDNNLPGSVLCQESGVGAEDPYQWNLGSLYSYSIHEVDDLTLNVTYGNGEYCAAANGYRNLTITYHCSTNTSQIVPANLSYVEYKTCNYYASVTVPYTKCSQATTPTLAPNDAPFCSSHGLWQDGVAWKLRNYQSPATQIEGAYYVLNLCQGSTHTFCPDSTVLCQEYNDQSFYSLGQRVTYNIAPATSDPTQLVVQYGLGDSTFCDRPRSVYIYFHCTDTPLFDVTENDDGIGCNYRLDAAVPTSMCQLQSPTNQPAPTLPVYCSANGYVSPTNRQWLLGSFVANDDFQSGYDWAIDLCDNNPNFQCADNVIMCQSGWRLGLRSTSHINTTASDDTTLVINYALGDNCGAYDRMTTLRFHCTSQQNNGETFTVNEGPQCVYTADIYVPPQYCPSIGGPPPEPAAPYCEPSGLYLNGRTWNFANVTASNPSINDGYEYILDVCGQTYTPCRADSALCQVSSFQGDNYWSLGSRSTWNIDKELSSSNTLAVYYGLGSDAYCTDPQGGGFPRSITILFQCGAYTDTPSDFTVISTGACVYQATVNLKPENCPSTAAPPSLPPYCTTDGYVSVTNRRWTLASLDVDDPLGGYEYLLNLCGDTGTLACPTSSVMCQITDGGDDQGYNLGNRLDWGVLPSSNDTVLQLTFINGQNCGGYGNRVTNIAFVCTSGSGAAIISEYENPTCNYNLVINVPASMCQPASTINTEAPWCGAGYLATTATTTRLWTLGDLSPEDVDPTGYNYFMDLCGLENTACTGTGAVICQQDDGGGVYNLGSRFAWTVLPTTDDSDLVVVYAMGDSTFCAGPRYTVFTFHCVTDGSYANYDKFNVTNHDYNCGYYVTINVPLSMCATASATNPPEPEAPFCSTGYLLNATYWTLADYVFDAKNGYDYTINLCGKFNTICSPKSVGCQSAGLAIGDSTYSIGTRSTWNVLEDQSDNATLVVSYTAGTDCGGYGARKTVIRFHCGGNTSSWNTTENPTCTYTIDVNVPTSMCQTVQPTYAPKPAADYCNPSYGYYDSYGTLWSLSSYTAADPTTYYDFVLDLCGNQPTTCTDSSTVLCQEVSETFGYKLADRSTAFVRTDLSTNGTLVLEYSEGDNCGAINRRTTMYLTCSDVSTPFMTVAENVTCNYNVYANVPTRFCKQNQAPTPTPLPVADYCTAAGYVSPTGRVWNLGHLNPNDEEGDYDYQLNLCGTFNTPCDPFSVLCQEAPDPNSATNDDAYYSCGLRGTQYIIASESNDTTIAVQYNLGDGIYCSHSRTTILYFHCTDQTHSSFHAQELVSGSCNYRGDVYVAKSLCSGTVQPTPPLPDFCYPTGHYDSTTGLYWTLQKFLDEDIQGDYDFQINLCGNSQTECVTDTAVCQQSTGPYAYSLASRYNFTWLPDTNGMLTLQYYGGDYCAAANMTRRLLVFLNCSDSPVLNNLEGEPETCNYNITIQVPSQFCSTTQPVVPTVPPVVETDFCTANGFASATGRTWSLASFVPQYDAQLNYNYVLNLCGTVPNNCDGTAAICQEAGETLGWSLGAYNNYTIDDSVDGVLKIHYFGGDYCSVANFTGDRESTVILTCTDNGPASFNVTELTPACHYTVTASVPTSYCGSGGAKDVGGGGKNLSGGAVAGITVAVVGVVVVAGAVGGITFFRVRNTRRFQSQTNVE